MRSWGGGWWGSTGVLPKISLLYPRPDLLPPGGKNRSRDAQLNWLRRKQAQADPSPRQNPLVSEKSEKKRQVRLAHSYTHLLVPFRNRWDAEGRMDARGSEGGRNNRERSFSLGRASDDRPSQGPTLIPGRNDRGRDQFASGSCLFSFKIEGCLGSKEEVRT